MIPGFSIVNCVLLLCWKLEMILGSLIFLLNHYILRLTHRTRKPLSFCRIRDWNKEWLFGVQRLFCWKDKGNSSYHLIKNSHVKNYFDPDYIGCNWRSWVKVPQQVSVRIWDPAGRVSIWPWVSLTPKACTPYMLHCAGPFLYFCLESFSL